MPNTVSLKPAELRRLEKLAAAAGRTPAAMLPFVLKDGFDYCERMIAAINDGISDLAAGNASPGAEVHARARATIVGHAKKAA